MTDGHAHVDDQPKPLRLDRQTTRSARPPRAARSPGRNRQKVEEHDNCYSSGGRAEKPKTAGRGVSNGGPCSYQRRTGTRHAANEEPATATTSSSSSTEEP